MKWHKMNLGKMLIFFLSSYTSPVTIDVSYGGKYYFTRIVIYPLFNMLTFHPTNALFKFMNRNDGPNCITTSESFTK